MKKKAVSKKYTTISIPTPLFKKIKRRIANTGFTSVSSYISYVLRELIAAEEEEEAKRSEEPFTKEDEEKIKARLRALGYLD